MVSNKYDIQLSNEEFNANIIRLTNQIWKLIPMRENNEDYIRQLDTVIIEIAGLKEIFSENSHFLQLLSKLEGLKITNIDFDTYRKTVFESISLLQENKK